MVIIHQNKLEKTTFSKMYVRICPSFWYQMAIFGVLAHGLLPPISFWILIALAKICFCHIVITAQKYCCIRGQIP